MSEDVHPNDQITSKAHPFLYHYTNGAGLEGILRSGNLRATHYQHLNDPTEITFIKEGLIPYTTEAIHPVVWECYLKGEPYQTHIRRANGVAQLARDLATNWIDALFRATLEPIHGEPPAFEPYVLSFCAHDSDEPVIQRNGLLSQWRAYGAEGGYAIVFQTGGLERLLSQEVERREAFIVMGDVVYSGDKQKFEEEFAELLRPLKHVTAGLLRRGEAESLQPVLRPFLKSVCRFKHWGYAEEREVRIVVYPGTDRHFDEGPDSNIRLAAEKKFEIHRWDDGRPYVELFANAAEGLPIAKVLVGPGRDQRERVANAKKLLRKHLKRTVPVDISEIPFLGMRRATHGRLG
jgi:hypothetical protein